jgi:molybdopterin molybdotransferase
MSLLSVEEAQRRLLDATAPLARSETLPLREADDRILSADIQARLTQPPFDASAMDGYALRAADAPDPGAVLKVIGTAAAGHGFDGTVGPGETVRIFTGAPVPAGADAILIQEDAEKLEGQVIRTTFPVTLGRHIRPRGQDFAEGETVLKAGEQLDFSRLMLVAAMNHATVEVFARPRVAILATGDELVSGEQPGRTRSSAPTPSASRRSPAAGAEVVDLGIVGDDRQRSLPPSTRPACGADISSPSAAPRSATTTWSSRRW